MLPYVCIITFKQNIMATKKEMYLYLRNLHTLQLNETDQEIMLVADSYYKGEVVEVGIVLRDIDFLEFISHNEIDEIKENLKKRIDEL
jgi:hypothetical protein